MHLLCAQVCGEAPIHAANISRSVP